MTIYLTHKKEMSSEKTVEACATLIVMNFALDDKASFDYIHHIVPVFNGDIIIDANTNPYTWYAAVSDQFEVKCEQKMLNINPRFLFDSLVRSVIDHIAKNRHLSDNDIGCTLELGVKPALDRLHFGDNTIVEDMEIALFNAWNVAVKNYQHRKYKVQDRVLVDIHQYDNVLRGVGTIVNVGLKDEQQVYFITMKVPFSHEELKITATEDQLRPVNE